MALTSSPTHPPASEGRAGAGRRFLLVAFVLAVAVGVAVGYLGVSGQIGGPIP